MKGTDLQLELDRQSAIKLARENWRLEDIAKAVRRSRNRVCEWVKGVDRPNVARRRLAPSNKAQAIALAATGIGRKWIAQALGSSLTRVQAWTQDVDRGGAELTAALAALVPAEAVRELREKQQAEALRARACALREAGRSFGEIGKELGISAQKAQRLAGHVELSPEVQKEITARTLLTRRPRTSAAPRQRGRKKCQNKTCQNFLTRREGEAAEEWARRTRCSDACETASQAVRTARDQRGERACAMCGGLIPRSRANDCKTCDEACEEKLRSRGQLARQRPVVMDPVAPAPPVVLTEQYTASPASVPRCWRCGTPTWRLWATLLAPGQREWRSECYDCACELNRPAMACGLEDVHERMPYRSRKQEAA